MKNPSFGALHSPFPSQSRCKEGNRRRNPTTSSFALLYEISHTMRNHLRQPRISHHAKFHMDHLEWPILGKLFGFHGCLLLDPWMSISYHLRAIEKWFKEDEMKGKRFFGFVDLALGCLKMVNEDKFPFLSVWMQEFANSPCQHILSSNHQDKMTAKFQALRHAKLAASPYLKKFGVHEYVMIHINMCPQLGLNF
ncbi:hypothetical protein AAG906_008085 [Vitis piasezkii]